jgi:hypothetical protein
LGHVQGISKNQAKAKKAFAQSKHIDAGLQVNEEDINLQTPKDPFGSSKDLVVRKQLDVILESYQEGQEKGFMWNLQYRGKTYEVEFVPFMIFLKCNTQEGDQLCGSYTSRTKNVLQFCQICCCPSEETDNPQANFPVKTVPMIKPLVDLKDLTALKEVSQQVFENSLYKIWFSPVNQRGIHGATVSEMLHAVLLGNFAMLRDCVFEQIGDKSKPADKFEALAMLYGKQCGWQLECGCSDP